MIEIRVPEFPLCAEPCGACHRGDEEPIVYVVEIPARLGEAVVADQTVAVVETDKTTVEVPAPCGGVVVQIAVQAGDRVGIGDLLAVVAPASPLRRG